MATTSNTKIEQLIECVDWVTRFLGNGPKQETDIYRYGRNVYGYQKGLLKRARYYVDPPIHVVTVGECSAWFLGPPPTEPTPQVPTEPGLIGTLLSSYPPKENHHGEEL